MPPSFETLMVAPLFGPKRQGASVFHVVKGKINRPIAIPSAPLALGRLGQPSPRGHQTSGEGTGLRSVIPVSYQGPGQRELGLASFENLSFEVGLGRIVVGIPIHKKVATHNDPKKLSPGMRHFEGHTALQPFAQKREDSSSSGIRLAAPDSGGSLDPVGAPTLTEGSRGKSANAFLIHVNFLHANNLHVLRAHVLHELPSVVLPSAVQRDQGPLLTRTSPGARVGLHAFLAQVPEPPFFLQGGGAFGV